MSLETRIFEGTWAEAIRHSEAIPSKSTRVDLRR